MPMTKPFVTVAEMARLLGVGKPQVYKLVAARHLPHVRRGRRVLIPREAWRRWCEAQADAALAAVTDGGSVH